ncbi:MAG TPA: UDP-N-acetylmuramoyl-tripeptide--D-alanyl-D-alanine ligase, partial [Anaerolineae bacterium]
MLTLADIMLSLGDPDISGIKPQLAELEKVPVREAVIDSRQVKRGDLFVALPGERVDGHVFVGHALGRGAIAAFVNQDIDLTDIPDAVWLDVRQASLPASLRSFQYVEGIGLIFRVDDALTALQRLSALWRSRFSPKLRVVGITGSVGKTTTKELIAQVLGIRFNVLKNEGNHNNEIGVPLTLLQLRPEHQVAVIEMGMYKLGEIALFAKLAQPQIGVITMVAPVHLERLGSIESIAAAKSELVESIPADGVVILNDDDERVRAMAAFSKARVVTYGLTPRANVWADEIESFGLDGISFTLHEGKEAIQMRVPLLGRHSVHTALRAAVVGRVEGLSWEEILEGFLVPSPQLRLAVAGGPFESLVLDDTYNASEEST